MKPFAIFVLLLLAAGCGGKQSVAEKSAEAYREAQAKGVAVGGDGHHHATPAPATTASDPHAAHRGATDASSAASEHAAHESMQHSAAPSTASDPHAAHGTSAQPATDADPHAAHRGAPAQPATDADPHAAHRGAAAQPATDPHAAHRGATGSQPAEGRRSGAAVAPREPQLIDPAATLTLDAFDAPVPISVREAGKEKKP